MHDRHLCLFKYDSFADSHHFHFLKFKFSPTQLEICWLMETSEMLCPWDFDLINKEIILNTKNKKLIGTHTIKANQTRCLQSLLLFVFFSQTRAATLRSWCDARWCFECVQRESVIRQIYLCVSLSGKWSHHARCLSWGLWGQSRTAASRVRV